MKKYKTYLEFESLNSEKLNMIQQSVRMLKSPDKMGEEGFILPEAEKLEHLFLTMVNTCSDILFGLSASVLDAQANVNSTEGLLYSKMEGGATDRNRKVACDSVYLEVVKHFNDLTDLKKYLEHKREDFMSNHYFYRAMRNNK